MVLTDPQRRRQAQEGRHVQGHIIQVTSSARAGRVPRARPLTGLTAHPAAAATSKTATGTGSTITEPFALDPGIYTVLFTHEGKATGEVDALIFDVEGELALVVPSYTGSKQFFTAYGHDISIDVEAPDGIDWTAKFTKKKLPTTPRIKTVTASGSATSSSLMYLLNPRRLHLQVRQRPQGHDRRADGGVGHRRGHHRRDRGPRQRAPRLPRVGSSSRSPRWCGSSRRRCTCRVGR